MILPICGSSIDFCKCFIVSTTFLAHKLLLTKKHLYIYLLSPYISKSWGGYFFINSDFKMLLCLSSTNNYHQVTSINHAFIIALSLPLFHRKLNVFTTPPDEYLVSWFYCFNSEILTYAGAGRWTWLHCIQRKIGATAAGQWETFQLPWEMHKQPRWVNSDLCH